MSISPSYALLLPRRATPRLLLASLPLLLLAWAAARQLDLHWARWLFQWEGGTWALKRSVLLEGVHYIRPFGGRKLLFIWEAIEKDITSFSMGRGPLIPMANGGVARG